MHVFRLPVASGTLARNMKKDIYAIILCGGSGTRLWPRSRSRYPKHLLTLKGASTLVQETVARQGLPLSNILCVTESSHASLLREQLPDIPEENIIVEPGRRGTASAIGLAMATLAERVDGDPIVYSVHADHIIQGQESYEASVAAWLEAARQIPRIHMLGIRPTFPSTGFGYISVGERIDAADGLDVFTIKQFVEKPDESTAKDYVDSGKYLWNAGFFAAQLSVFQNEVARHMPTLVQTLERMFNADTKKQRAEEYLSLENVPIEYGVFEKSDQLAVLPASFSWADVGSWADLHDMLERDGDGNVFEGNYVDIDSHDCFIYSPNHLVATVGLSNLVIISTGDAVLICPKERSQDVKKIVEQLKDRNMTKYL